MHTLRKLPMIRPARNANAAASMGYCDRSNLHDCSAIKFKRLTGHSLHAEAFRYCLTGVGADTGGKRRGIEEKQNCVGKGRWIGSIGEQTVLAILDHLGDRAAG